MRWLILVNFRDYPIRLLKFDHGQRRRVSDSDVGALCPSGVELQLDAKTRNLVEKAADNRAHTLVLGSPVDKLHLKIREFDSPNQHLKVGAE